MEEVIEEKKKIFKSITDYNLANLLVKANDIGLTKEEFIQIIPTGGQMILIYFREKK